MSGYRYRWALFADWCDAAETSPLPASPITLAQFLDENPAGDTVQLRRVSAINRAHLDAGHPAPSRVTSMRFALDSARTAEHHSTPPGYDQDTFFKTLFSVCAVIVTPEDYAQGATEYCDHSALIRRA